VRVLLLAWGNPARQDDGLGPAIAAALESLAPPGVTISCDYQLQVEDACAISEHDVVVFVDASTTGDEPFAFTPVEPHQQASFSSHSVSAEALLGLSERCFSRRVPGWLLAVRGYAFEPFEEQLTPRAARNLEVAVAFLHQQLRGEPLLALATGGRG
jgi:hydrogenase maturation protease